MDSIRITSKEELQLALAIRTKVFVEEQDVPHEAEFDEYDQLDGRCEHVLVTTGGTPAGTGRIRIPEAYAKLERICVLPEFRKSGAGQVILNALEEIAREKGILSLKLHAQTHAENFYSKAGYVTKSDVFMEEGIPHVVMMKEITPSNR